jgi:hypothetical protein
MRRDLGWVSIMVLRSLRAYSLIEDWISPDLEVTIARIESITLSKVAAQVSSKGYFKLALLRQTRAPWIELYDYLWLSINIW